MHNASNTYEEARGTCWQRYEAAQSLDWMWDPGISVVGASISVAIDTYLPALWYGFSEPYGILF